MIFPRMSKAYQNIVTRISSLILIGFFFSINPLNATHLVGTDMSFKCLGNDFYEITLIVRRDCINGAPDAPFDNPAIVGIFDNNGRPLQFLGRFGQVVMTYDEVVEVDVQSEDCEFLGGPICVSEAVYKAQVFLPFREKGYVLAYQRCCRNITLNNIINPLETGTTKFICLTEKTLNECNSSPEFIEWPEVVICANEPLSFDHSAIDIDGDSLAYKLYIPHAGATIDDPKPQPPAGRPYDEVAFAPGYGLDNLLGGTPLEVDVNTGLITAVPNTIGQFLVGVMVEEWRDGELLSATRRDFEYNVRACLNKALEIDFVADTVASCSGDPVALLESARPGVTYEWTPLEGLTFEDNEFFSDPMAAPSENTVYSVLAYNEEDTVRGEITVILSDYPEYDISRDTLELCEGALENILINTNPSNTVTWLTTEGLVISDPYSPTNPGFIGTEGTNEYVFVVSNGFCEVFDTITIDLIPTEFDEVSEAIEANFIFDTINNQFTFSINESELFSLFDIVSIRWVAELDDLVFSGEGTFIDINLPYLSDVKVTYYFTDSQGCEYFICYNAEYLFDDILSDFIDLAGGGSDTVAVCSGDPVALLNSAVEGITYTWTPLEGLTFGDTIFFSDPIASPSEATDYVVSATDGITTQMDTISVILSEYPEYTVSRDTLVVCEGATETIMINTESSNTVTWLDAEGLIVTSPFSTTNPGFRANDSVSQYTFFVSNGFCEVTGIVTIDLIPTEVDEVEASIDTSYSFDTLTNQFIFSINEEELISQFDIVSIRWTVESGGELYTGEGGDIDIVLPEGAEEARVTYYFTDSQGCEYSITYVIDLNNGDDDTNDFIDLAGGGSDTVAVCSGDPVALLNSAVEGITYTWTPLEGLTFGDTIFFSDPIASPSEATDYVVSATDGITTQMDTISVILSEYPEYTVSRDTLVVCEGATETIMINTESSNTVTWLDAEGLIVTSPFSTTNPGFRANDSVSQYTFFVSNGFCEVTGIVTIDLIPTEVDEVEASIDTSYSFDTLTNQFIFSINEEELISQFDIVSIRWTVESGGELYTGEGGDIDIVLPEGAEEARVTYYFTDSQGCEYSITYVIDLNPDNEEDVLSLEFIYEDSITVCLGESSRIIANPNSSWTYTWMPEDDLIFESSEDKSNPTFVGTESRTYVVSVTDGMSTITDTIFMRITTDEIELTFSNTSATACNDITNLMVNNPDHSSNTMYEWALAESFDNVVATSQFVAIRVVNDSTRVFVRATDRNFCESNIAFIDVFKIEPDYDILFDSIDICITDMSTVTFVNNDVSQDLMIEWEPSDNIISDITVNPIMIQTTPHTTEVNLAYTITDGMGCEISDNLIIPIDNVLDLDVMLDNNGEVCGTAMLSVTSQEEDATYEWSFDNEFSEIIAMGSQVEVNLTQEGPVTVYVRGEHPEYCDSEIGSIEIENDRPDFEFEFDPLNTCISNSTEIDVVSGDPQNPVTITWEENDRITSDLNSLPILVTAMEGDEIIVLAYNAMDSEGCSVDDILEIEVIDELIADIIIDSTSCNGDFGVLSGSVNGSEANYEWSLFSDFSSVISTEETISISLPEGQPIFLRASTELCESQIDSVILSENGFMVESDAPRKICDGDMVDITTSNSMRDFDIIWEPSDNITSVNGKIVSIQTLPDQDTIRLDYTATSTDGCIDEGTIVIPYGDIITPAPEVANNCGTYGLSFDVGPDFIDGDISWDFGVADDDSDNSNLANPTFDFGGAGTYNVTLTSISSTCQFETFMIEVEVPEIITFMTDNETSISVCEGDQDIEFGISNNLDLPVVWVNQSGDTLSMIDSLTINTSEFDSITVIATDENGCSEMLTFTKAGFDIDLDILFPDQIGNDTIVCAGQPFSVSIRDTTNAMLSYEWAPASAVISGQGTSDVMISLDQQTEISVIVTDLSSGCSETILINPTVTELDVEVVADPDSDIFLGESVTIIANSSGEIVSYEWDNGGVEMSQIVSPTETTTYTVIVTDINGCSATSQITITVEQPLCDETDVFIPSAFSPNNDGNNDVLFVRSNFVEEMDFQIVNRWGQEVFRSVNQRDGWNGRFGGTGREMEPDVYAYCVKVTCVDGKEFIKAGNVTLMR